MEIERAGMGGRNTKGAGVLLPTTCAWVSVGT